MAKVAVVKGVEVGKVSFTDLSDNGALDVAGHTGLIEGDMSTFHFEPIWLNWG